MTDIERLIDEVIARDLQVLMHAVWHAESASLAHAALLTRLGGMTLNEVATLEHDPAGAQRISLRFHDWRQRWRRRGVPALSPRRSPGSPGRTRVEPPRSGARRFPWR